MTDRGDASGTGYWAASTGRYRDDLFERGLGHGAFKPRVLGPADVAGQTSSGLLLGPGSGDNAAAALGLGAELGDVIVSIGTSGVVCAVAEQPTQDPSGTVAGFADATGRYLPLVATLNAARVLDAATRLLGIDHDDLSDLALSAPPGADGLVLVPYLEGERTPNRPDATGAVHGLTLATSTPAHLARAAIEGLMCGLADAVEAVEQQGVTLSRLILIGGAARSLAVRQIASAVLGLPVMVPTIGEYVARGAARQAAWALSDQGLPPVWPLAESAYVDVAPTPDVRDRYADVRDLTANRPTGTSP